MKTVPSGAHAQSQIIQVCDLSIAIDTYPRNICQGASCVFRAIKQFPPDSSFWNRCHDRSQETVRTNWLSGLNAMRVTVRVAFEWPLERPERFRIMNPNDGVLRSRGPTGGCTEVVSVFQHHPKEPTTYLYPFFLRPIPPSRIRFGFLSRPIERARRRPRRCRG